MSLVIDFKSEGDQLFVELNGRIDELSFLPPTDLWTCTQVIFDMEGLEGLSSEGIRRWLGWVTTFSKVKSIVRNCPKTVVDQMNALANFLPEGSKVESFFVPYYNEEKNTERLVLFRSGTEFKASHVFAPSDIKGYNGAVSYTHLTLPTNREV